MSPATDPVTATGSLRKTYGDVTAVEPLDLAVHAGEVFGFLGPNGAGKSTTIDVLLGLVPIWRAVLKPGLRAVLPGGLEPSVDSLNPTSSRLRTRTSPPDAGVVAVVVAVVVSAGVLPPVGVVGLAVGYRRFERADPG